MQQPSVPVLKLADLVNICSCRLGERGFETATQLILHNLRKEFFLRSQS